MLQKREWGGGWGGAGVGRILVKSCSSILSYTMKTKVDIVGFNQNRLFLIGPKNDDCRGKRCAWASSSSSFFFFFFAI